MAGQDQRTIWAGTVACQAQVFISPRRSCACIAAVRAADVIVVVAGTDGALPSVVAGLVEAPVIAVPTSVGYGAALQVPRQLPSRSLASHVCAALRVTMCIEATMPCASSTGGCAGYHAPALRAASILSWHLNGT